MAIGCDQQLHAAFKQFVAMLLETTAAKASRQAGFADKVRRQLCDMLPEDYLHAFAERELVTS